jgi:hypothetical protein
MIIMAATQRRRMAGMDVYRPPFTSSEGSSGAKCRTNPHARHPRNKN